MLSAFTNIAALESRFIASSYSFQSGCSLPAADLYAARSISFKVLRSVVSSEKIVALPSRTTYGLQSELEIRREQFWFLLRLINFALDFVVVKIAPPLWNPTVTILSWVAPFDLVVESTAS